MEGKKIKIKSYPIGHARSSRTVNIDRQIFPIDRPDGRSNQDLLFSSSYYYFVFFFLFLFFLYSLSYRSVQYSYCCMYYMGSSSSSWFSYILLFCFNGIFSSPTVLFAGYFIYFYLFCLYFLLFLFSCSICRYCIKTTRRLQPYRWVGDSHPVSK